VGGEFRGRRNQITVRQPTRVDRLAQVVHEFDEAAQPVRLGEHLGHGPSDTGEPPRDASDFLGDGRGGIPTQSCQVGREEVRGALVGRPRPAGIDAQGRGATIAVAESAGGGAQVHAGGQELGGVEVAQVLQRLRDTDLLGHPPVGVGEVVRMPGMGTQRLRREDKGLRRQLEVPGHQGSLAACLQRPEELDREHVQRQPALVVGLRTFELVLPPAHHIVRSDAHQEPVEVEARPLQGHQLPPPGTRRDRKPEEDGELLVGGGGRVEQLGDLLRLRRPRASLRLLGGWA
jgi:hypothetical protein